MEKNIFFKSASVGWLLSLTGIGVEVTFFFVLMLFFFQMFVLVLADSTSASNSGCSLSGWIVVGKYRCESASPVFFFYIIIWIYLFIVFALALFRITPVSVTLYWLFGRICEIEWESFFVKFDVKVVDAFDVFCCCYSWTLKARKDM